MEFGKAGKTAFAKVFPASPGSNISLEAISTVFKNGRKSLLRPVKWSVFGLSSIASAKEDGSHAQTTISNSSTIFFQPNFAGLLKLPL